MSARAHVLCTRRAEERQDASRQDFASVNGSWITQEIPSGFQPSAVGPCLPSCSWRTRVRTGGESAREKESAHEKEKARARESYTYIHTHTHTHTHTHAHAHTCTHTCTDTHTHTHTHTHSLTTQPSYQAESCAYSAMDNRTACCPCVVRLQPGGTRHKGAKCSQHRRRLLLERLPRYSSLRKVYAPVNRAGTNALNGGCAKTPSPGVGATYVQSGSSIVHPVHARRLPPRIILVLNCSKKGRKPKRNYFTN